MFSTSSGSVILISGFLNKSYELLFVTKFNVKFTLLSINGIHAVLSICKSTFVYVSCRLRLPLYSLFMFILSFIVLNSFNCFIEYPNLEFIILVFLNSKVPSICGLLISIRILGCFALYIISNSPLLFLLAFLFILAIKILFTS